MTDSSTQEALERRRTQNREAQRRFRRKKNLQASVDWNEVLNNVLSPSCIDIQSSEFPSADSPFSPSQLPNQPPFTCTLGYFSCLTPPHSENSPQDVDPFLENTSTPPAQNIDSTFSTSGPSPTSSAAIIGTHDNFPGSLPSNPPLTRSGSITSTGHGYGLGSDSPHDYTPPSAVSGTSARGWLSPLHMAAQKGNDRIVRLLLQQGVDCNERDSDGLTPMMHGVIGGHEEVVRSLLLHGACIGDDSGQPRPSALHLAVLHHRENILRVLLNHCRDERRLIDGYDDVGRTPLHIAIETDFEAAVLTLLQYGADPQHKAPKPQKIEIDLEGLHRIDIYRDEIE